MDSVVKFVDFLFRNAEETQSIKRKKQLLISELQQRVKNKVAQGMDEKKALEAAINEFDDLFSYVLMSDSKLPKDESQTPETTPDIEPEEAQPEPQEQAVEPESVHPQEQAVEPESVQPQEDTGEPELIRPQDEAGQPKEQRPKPEPKTVTWEDSQIRPLVIDNEYSAYTDQDLHDNTGAPLVKKYKLWLWISVIATPITTALIFLLYRYAPLIPYIKQNTVKHADTVGLSASITFLVIWPLIQYILYFYFEDEGQEITSSPALDIIYTIFSWIILCVIFYLCNYIFISKNISKVVWWHYCSVALFAYPLSSMIRYILLKSKKFYK